MANLACVGSHAINGVAALHSDLLRRFALKDFGDLWPERFSNKTNGVTPRRFVALSNPGLTRLINQRIGDKWLKDINQLRQLEKFADDKAFHKQWHAVKLENKQRLSTIIKERTGVVVQPESLFDFQVKRIHEYKRQHLNVLHIIRRYLDLKQNPKAQLPPRTFLLGGKAAPGYFMAKLIIKLVHSVADVVNHDPAIQDRVVFFPDFSVKNAQNIYPAADLSEQISTAGKEASGTGNMKFAMNGALTIGTLDGANVEIREEVGDDNFFLFGLTTEQVEDWKARGYHPRELYDSQPRLRETLDAIADGTFSGRDTSLFRPIIDHLLNHDTYMLLADFQSYIDCQTKVNAAWGNPAQWRRMSILNVARVGKFSSDRAIAEYCKEIWNVPPVHIEVPT
jgi:starch phosphorylase